VTRRRSNLRLPFQAPYHWTAILSFLTPRLTAGLESVTEDAYQRRGVNWTVTVTHAQHELLAEIDGPAPKDTEAKLRHLFDLDADIGPIEDHLSRFPALQSHQHPGLRLPGCWDPFELLIRAILGQQVSVKGAATLSARLVDHFGPPTPQALAEADVALIGIPGQRAACIRAAAQAMLDGLTFDRLETVKGIGPWTAEYVRMRALHDRDAFPASDLVLLKKSGHSDPRRLTAAAEPWRPYRAYAAMHIWRSAL